jgi:RNA polymerase sigma-70 factor (ECF subfamily)
MADGRHAPTIEVDRAIRGLSDADLARLGSVARLRTRGLWAIDWEDALHEAFARAIDGSRKWPRDVPFIVFLAETIRSITSEAWRVQQRDAARRSARPVEDLASELASPLPGPEQAVIERGAAAEILALFTDDAVASGILLGIADGASPLEVQERLNITRTDYDSARRRIRRRVTRWLGGIE